MINTAQPARPSKAPQPCCSLAAGPGKRGRWRRCRLESQEPLSRHIQPSGCHEVEGRDRRMGLHPWEVPQSPIWPSRFNEQRILAPALSRKPKKLEPLAQSFLIGAILLPQGAPGNVWRQFSSSQLGGRYRHVAGRSQGRC